MIYDNQIENLPATFNSYDLNSSANRLKVLSIDAVNAPTTIVNQYKLVRQDGEIVTNSEFGKRIIKIEGRLTGTTSDNLDSRIDTLKSNLVGIDKNLDLTINGITRRVVATVQNTSYLYKTGCVCLWTIEFTCAAFGKNTSSTALTFGTYTASNTTYTNTIAGSYKSNVLMTLAATRMFPYYESAYINIENAAVNERIRLTREWGWFDTVTIDGDSKSVTLYPTTKTVIDDMDTLATSTNAPAWRAGTPTVVDDCDNIISPAWTATNGLISQSTSVLLFGTGSIKAAMAVAASTLSLNKLNFTPSVNWGAATGLFLVFPMYISTPASGTVASVRITMGSDATIATNSLLWTITTQYDGSAFVYDAWNYIELDLATAATSTTGAPNRAAIISLSIRLNATATMQISGGWFIDDITSSTVSRTRGALSLNETTNLQGVGALQMTMSSAASTMTPFTKLNFTPSIDINTAAGYVIIPIFVPTPTSGTLASVDFSFGSDATLASNKITFNKTLQHDGSSIATNAWNYFAIDLSTGGTVVGTPVRTAIISMSITLNATATMKLVGVLLDYTTIQIASIVGEVMDYEGTFPDLNVGSCSLAVTDELDSRSIVITGSYYKRYI
jgi:hypothetical protein